MPEIKSISPGAVVEGGKVLLDCTGYDPSMFSRTVLRINGLPVRMSTIARGFISASIPPDASSGPVVLEVAGVPGNGVYLEVARRLATNLHPVASPAIDDSGNMYITLSGMRGQKLPVSIYKVSSEGSIIPFASNILNPTGIAINRDGELFVTNRRDGTVHKVSPSGNHAIFASGLGVCTGLTFDREENLYVGDREGAIYRLDRDAKKETFAKLPPSVAAYHMAFGPDGALYATAPTMSGYDHIYKINSSGQPEIFFSELGRPQGLAFDSEGNLHLVAYYQANAGIFKITSKKVVTYEVAGVNLVGLAFDGRGNMIITSISSVYRLKTGLKGLPVS